MDSNKSKSGKQVGKQSLLKKAKQKHYYRTIIVVYDEITNSVSISQEVSFVIKGMFARILM